MIDIEKVIKGLECCVIGGCPSIFSKAYAECPYTDSVGHCKMDCLHRDALELLKKRPEIIRCKDCKHRSNYYSCDLHSCFAALAFDNFFCADGEKK